MDRVLLIIDDVQFSGHLEMTLRKLGCSVETLQSEFSLNQKILGFNPDFILVRGNGTRVSNISAIQKIRESYRYQGKVAAVFQQSPDQTQIKDFNLDCVLVEPVTGLSILQTILNLDPKANASRLEKLLKISESDPVFKQNEESFMVSGNVSASKQEPGQNLDAPKDLHAKIEKYNKDIDALDVDLKQGLSKRQTKAKSNRGLRNEQNMEIDEERKRFVAALFEKK